MEQPVWLFFGIIAILIALGIVARVVIIHQTEIRSEILSDSLSKLITECNFVCGTTEGNLLSIDVDFPADSYVYTKGNKICTNYDNSVRCARCNCALEESSLNLTTELAKRIKEHKYSCFFEKLKEGIKMDCRG